MSLAFVREQLVAARQVPSNKYSMWWPVADDAAFSASPLRGVIRGVYEALDGIHSYVFADIVNVLERASDSMRIGLPARTASFRAIDREGRPLVLSAAAEKGIRLHLPQGATSAAQRLQMWTAFAAYVAAWRGVVRSAGQPDDPPLTPRPLDWWTKTDSLVVGLEATSPATNVGTLEI
jgi:hypothetical protein